MIRGALVLLLLCGPALADDDTPEKAQARVLLGQGNALFERGELQRRHAAASEGLENRRHDRSREVLRQPIECVGVLAKER